MGARCLWDGERLPVDGEVLSFGNVDSLGEFKGDRCVRGCKGLSQTQFKEPDVEVCGYEGIDGQGRGTPSRVVVADWYEHSPLVCP